MNSITLSGRIVKDIELKTSTKGTKYVMFTVADKKNKDTTFFFDCSATGATAENIAKFFIKGDQIIITGSLQQTKYKDSKLNNNTIFVTAFDFGAKKGGNSTESDEPFDI